MVKSHLCKIVIKAVVQNERTANEWCRYTLGRAFRELNHNFNAVFN